MMPGDAVAVTHSVVPIRRLALTYSPRPWPFASERRAEIDAYFENLRQTRPGIWNGRALLMHRHRIDGDLLEGAFLETDYASFMAWRDWGSPSAGVVNCFSMGALKASDGAWLLGVMAPHTSPAGKIYFPAGTLEPDDIVEGMVDLAGSVAREVAEETGLGPANWMADSGWTCVLEGSRIALMKVLRLSEPADASRRRILAHLARERMPELSDIRIVRDRRDLDAMMPSFMIAFLEHVWS